MQDKVGWEKSTEVLQNRCLLIADRTLQDIEAGAKKTGSSVEGSTNVSVSSERDCNHPNPVVPNVSLFSCATLSTDGKVLSDVFAEASRMRGELNKCGCVIGPCCSGHPHREDIPAVY